MAPRSSNAGQCPEIFKDASMIIRWCFPASNRAIQLMVEAWDRYENPTVGPERMPTPSPPYLAEQRSAGMEDHHQQTPCQKAWIFARISHQPRTTCSRIVIPYNKREVLNYAQVIPYEPWKYDASLNLVETAACVSNNEEDACSGIVEATFHRAAKRLVPWCSGCLYSADCGGGENHVNSMKLFLTSTFLSAKLWSSRNSGG